MECLRMPICSVLGHVDHGKSTVLDFIRKTSIVNSEPGAITQSIGASIVPLQTIKNICGDTLGVLRKGLSIPGLLFIDTPGHAAFTSLRKRGGNIADIAILVVDINEGFKPQTKEAIEILKAYRTPFVVVANKLDLLPGWRRLDEKLLKNVGMQSENMRQQLDKKLYEIVGNLSESGFVSERFDRVDDYTKQVGIIPASGKTGEGIPEMLVVLIGLTQKYLEKTLKCDVDGFAKGTILEVKDEKGLGCCVDAIIYDGKLSVNDTIVVGTLDEPVVVKVRSLFQPNPLAEMRDKKAKFLSVKSVNAATGVRISAPGIENATAGMPIIACSPENIEAVKKEIRTEIEESTIDTEDTGIVVKADSLGSLEALVKLLQEKEVPIRKASIGNITKKDVADAESNIEEDALLGVVLGFNVRDASNMKTEVKVITGNIVYSLIDEFEKWQEEKRKALEAKELDNVVRPFKLQILKGYVFRQNNPAIVGVHVLLGNAVAGTPLMKDGKQVTVLKSIQKENESVGKAEQGDQVAASLPNVTVGRQIREEDELYSAVSEDDFRKMKELKKYLTKGEIEALKQIAKIYRQNNPVWGV